MGVCANNQGFSLLEVLISMVIIVVISSITFQYHLNIINNNSVLAKTQKDLFLSESQFDVDYGLAERWGR